MRKVDYAQRVTGKRKFTPTELSKFIRERREKAGMSTADVEDATDDLPPEFRISSGYAWQIEQGAKPSPFKLLTLARVIGFKLSDAFKAIGASDEDICAHVWSAHEEIVVLGLREKDRCDLYLMLNWILAQGNEGQRTGIRENLISFFRNVVQDHGPPPWQEDEVKKDEAKS